MQQYNNWIASGHHGSMSYLERNVELRQNPGLLVPDTRSVIVVAQNYYPKVKQDPDKPQFAYYAYGRDYHKVVKKKLDKLLQFIREYIDPDVQGRSFADSAPIMERYWAQQSGIGWIGKNGLIIIPNHGSYFFLGELLINMELFPDNPMASKCGSCTRCMDSCPTQAIVNPTIIDARRCISYLTIENKDEIPEELASHLENRIYGCDACQQCCPWNRFARPTDEDDFTPKPHFWEIDYHTIHDMDESSYMHHFSGMAIKRAGLDGLRKNLRALHKQAGKQARSQGKDRDSLKENKE